VSAPSALSLTPQRVRRPGSRCERPIRPVADTATGAEAPPGAENADRTGRAPRNADHSDPASGRVVSWVRTVRPARTAHCSPGSSWRAAPRVAVWAPHPACRWHRNRHGAPRRGVSAPSTLSLTPQPARRPASRCERPIRPVADTATGTAPRVAVWAPHPPCRWHRNRYDARVAVWAPRPACRW